MDGVKSSTGVSSAGRRFGHEAARAAIHEPALSRITEGSNEAGSVKGGAPSVADASPDPREKIRSLAKRAIESKFAVALIVFVFTMGLLLALNPPMAQKPSADPGAPPARSVKKIVVWSSLAGAAALLVPFCVGLVKKDA